MRVSAIFFLLLIPSICIADSLNFTEIENVQTYYNVQTLMTKDYAYIILETQEPGECEYGTEEFKYGEGKKFENINGTIHRAKIKVEEGKSYQFKIKCVIEGKSGEEDITFSLSHITFFLLETLEQLKRDVTEFEKRRLDYEGRIGTEDLEKKIKELEGIIREAEKCIETNNIKELREEVSRGIRKKREIENTFLIKSIQLSIYEKSLYVILIIIISYLLLYFVTSFWIPYAKIKKNLKILKEKEEEMKNLRKSTELLYFNRKIDEDTFNKMIIKEQEEIMRLRVKISMLEKRKREIIGNLFKIENIIEWSLKEKIHIRDLIKNLWKKINKK